MARPGSLTDVFGHALEDAVNGRPDSIVLERDDGYVDTFPSSVLLQRLPEWPPIERWLLRSVRPPALDLGCGAGRVALVLQERGMRVLAIDQSPRAVRVARRRGVREARVMDLFDLRLPPNRFRTVLLFGNNFGMFGTPSRMRQILRQLHGLTADGARIIGTGIDPYRTDEPAHRRYHTGNRRRGRMPGEVRLRARYHAYQGPWFRLLWVSPKELHRLVQGTGFRVLGIRRSQGPQYAAILERQSS
jgi:SAM-dependent methyltransferase